MKLFYKVVFIVRVGKILQKIIFIEGEFRIKKRNVYEKKYYYFDLRGDKFIGEFIGQEIDICII